MTIPVLDRLEGAVSVLQRTFANVDIINTTTETVLGSVVVPGGSLGSDRAVVYEIWGDFLQASGSSQTFTIRLKWGGTTIFQDVSPAFASVSGVRYAHALKVVLMMQGTTTQCTAHLIWQFGAALAAPTTGVGDMSADGTLLVGQSATGGADSAVNNTLEVTAQFGTATTNLSLRNLYSLATLL